MKVVKNIFRYIMAIILAMSIVVLLVINLASSTILNQNYITKQLEKADYYNKIYELIYSNFENYIYQSGLDKEVLENLVTVEKIKNDTNTIIMNVYSGITEEIDIQELKDQMSNNIEKSVQSIYGRSLSVTEKKSVDDLIEKLAKEYTDTIFYFNIEKQINNVYSKVVKILDMVKAALCITIGVAIIMLILLSLRRIYKIFTMSGIALISSGLFFVIANYVINSKIKIQTITIYNDAISTVIRNIGSNILASINTYGIILLISGIALVVISNLVHNIIKQKYMEEE